jgi:hypothetical protein
MNESQFLTTDKPVDACARYAYAAGFRASSQSFNDVH